MNSLLWLASLLLITLCLVSLACVWLWSVLKKGLLEVERLQAEVTEMPQTLGNKINQAYRNSNQGVRALEALETRLPSWLKGFTWTQRWINKQRHTSS